MAPLNRSCATVFLGALALTGWCLPGAAESVSGTKDHHAKVFNTAQEGTISIDRLFLRLTTLQFAWLDQGGSLESFADIVRNLLNKSGISKELEEDARVASVVEALAQYRRSCLALGDDESKVDAVVSEDVGYWLQQATKQISLSHDGAEHSVRAAFDAQDLRVAVELDGQYIARANVPSRDSDAALAVELGGVLFDLRCGPASDYRYDSCRIYFQKESIVYWQFPKR